MRTLELHRLLGLALLTLVSATAAHAQQAASAPSLRGDVNGDGRVTAADAQAVRDHVAGRPVQPGMRLLPNGDANGDGRITGVDAAMIQAFAAGRDVSRFGVGQAIRGGAGGGGEKKGYMTAVYECTVDVEAGTESCQTARPAMAASADLVLEKPLVALITTGAVTMRSDAANEDTTQANLAIQNNIGQPIGTTDGTTAAASGVRVFFHDGPRVTAVKSGTLASATVRLEGTDGTANFAGPEGEFAHTNKPFIQYDGVVATGDTSVSKLWRFVYSSNTKTFFYAYAVSAPVQYEFGWITLAPGSLVLGEGEASSPLAATAYDATGTTVSDGITWSSSDPAVATVDASTGVVTGVAPGTATITATSTVKAQRKGSIPVTVDALPTLLATTPADNATQVASSTSIELTFSEPVDVTTSSFTLECPAGTAKTFTVGGSGTAAVTLNPDADLPAGTLCTVKMIGSQVSDSDTNDGPNNPAGDRTFSFEVNIQAVDDVFGTTTTGNVRINSANTTPAFSVTGNDQTDLATTTITFAGWNAVGGKTQQGGDVTMTMSGAGMGEFVYNPPAGFEGTDSLEYTITSGAASASAKVALPVSGMIWFVNNTGAPCTSRANGCGRLTNPYSTLAAFQAENDGTGNNPAANEAIFVYQSTTAYAGPVTLQNGQKLIGQDATGTLQDLSGITPAAGSDAFPAMDAAGDAVTIRGTDGVNLGAGNLLRGLTLAPATGEAIGGTSFGTLTLSTTTPDLTINAGSQALALTTGTITGTFTSVASAGGTNNVLLSGVTGDIDFGAGALSGSTGGAIKIVGAPLTLDASGSITQTTAAPLLDVSGTHTGTLTFTGTLNATAGVGLQFSDADGSYSFGGTTTLNGGDAGIDITTGSAGTFSFASGTSVTNPSGTAFRVASSTPGVTFNGNLTK
ncbi:MAG TPA: Ig-like domain-containing protein, partial [Longimicrobium sp.]